MGFVTSLEEGIDLWTGAGKGEFCDQILRKIDVLKTSIFS